MIAVIDSGVANLTSVLVALDRLNIKATATADPVLINRAEKVILPGVGSAQAAMAKLSENGLINIIRALTQPVLGICLGMQLLFDASEEGAQAKQLTPGLGLIAGTIRKLQGGAQTPIPHMGWNTISPLVPDHPLLKDVGQDAFVYFVHSFAAPEGPTTLASCNHGQRFTAMCAHKNFFGCQFHPERSGATGQKILQNFCDMRL